MKMNINCFSRRGFFAFISLCGILLCFAQCKNNPEEAFKTKGGLRVLVGFDEAFQASDDGSVEIRNRLMDVLHSRIAYYGVTPHIKWLEAENCILMEIPGVEDPERVLRILQQHANFEFWETYNLPDILEQLISADEQLTDLLATEKESASSDEQEKDGLDALLEFVAYESESEKSHPLLSILMLDVRSTTDGYVANPGPLVGCAQNKDMGRIMEYLHMEEIKSMLPSQLVFRWGVKPIDEGEDIYELYALRKTARQGAALDGNIITKAKVEPDNSGNYVISLQMNDEGTQIWARLTKDNIGRCIAMVVDDKVYSAPCVQSEITRGRSIISGNFTKEEVEDLASALNAGKMLVPVRIIQSEMVLPAKK